MIGLDYEEKRGAPFCPIMGERCVSGWTKKMGQSDDGQRPVCVAWRGIPMSDIKTAQVREVHACSVYEWPVFQSFEVITLLQQGRASTDKVASEVAKHHATFASAIAQRQQLLENGG